MVFLSSFHCSNRSKLCKSCSRQSHGSPALRHRRAVHNRSPLGAQADHDAWHGDLPVAHGRLRAGHSGAQGTSEWNGTDRGMGWEGAGKNLEGGTGSWEVGEKMVL